MTSPLFRFSLLSLALAAGFAHAENEAKESVTLDTVTVKGQAMSFSPVSGWSRCSSAAWRNIRFKPSFWRRLLAW